MLQFCGTARLSFQSIYDSYENDDHDQLESQSRYLSQVIMPSSADMRRSSSSVIGAPLKPLS
jgi:hypothetical protein